VWKGVLAFGTFVPVNTPMWVTDPSWISSAEQARARGSRVPLLFSYGTLRDSEVQLATFGRLLAGSADALAGFAERAHTVVDAEFVASSGKAQHAILVRDAAPGSRVLGIALDVTEEELARADRYEPAGYTRIAVVLASGREAWVYVADSAA